MLFLLVDAAQIVTATPSILSGSMAVAAHVANRYLLLLRTVRQRNPREAAPAVESSRANYDLLETNRRTYGNGLQNSARPIHAFLTDYFYLFMSLQPVKVDRVNAADAAFALAQIVVMYTVLRNSPYWLKVAHAIVG